MSGHAVALTCRQAGERVAEKVLCFLFVAALLRLRICGTHIAMRSRLHAALRAMCFKAGLLGKTERVQGNKGHRY